MIRSMGHFTAIGMREPVRDHDAMVVNTCGDNDGSEAGTPFSWDWCNPTNRAITHKYHDLEAVSVECLWQGTKIFMHGGHPNVEALQGNWRIGKARRPIGAYAGPVQELIKDPGEARRTIYVPAYANLVEHWINHHAVNKWLNKAQLHDGPVYLRDFDTGRGINQMGPMSHAWLLATWLNTGEWPTE